METTVTVKCDTTLVEAFVERLKCDCPPSMLDAVVELCDSAEEAWDIGLLQSDGRVVVQLRPSSWLEANLQNLMGAR